MAQTIDYKKAGVDVNEGYKAVDKYRKQAERARIPGQLTDLGAFNGMFAVPKGMKNPVMVSGTDGVGTKLDIAFKLKKYDTVGIDCVAMSVNDILCSGVKTSFFLDYIACGKLDSKIAGELVKGVTDGCLDAGCALLGGGTAEMPDENQRAGNYSQQAAEAVVCRWHKRGCDYYRGSCSSAGELLPVIGAACRDFLCSQSIV